MLNSSFSAHECFGRLIDYVKLKVEPKFITCRDPKELMNNIFKLIFQIPISIQFSMFIDEKYTRLILFLPNYSTNMYQRKDQQ